MKACLTLLDVLDGRGVKQCLKRRWRCVCVRLLRGVVGNIYIDSRKAGPWLLISQLSPQDHDEELQAVAQLPSHS